MRTIYLNHAGTSWPKPEPVISAAQNLFESDPAEWPQRFSDAHQVVADFFHVDRARLLLTPSCTAALHLAIQDHAWQAGDRVLTSHFEHHASQRPLEKLRELGVEVNVLPFSDKEPVRLESLEHELRKEPVKLLALTAACNVTGRLLPISQAIELAHQFGTLVLVDGAQIAGWWDLNVEALRADLFTFAGHKAPHAPWGVGGLYVKPSVSMKCTSAVCEIVEDQASVMPGYCDAGSVNLASLVGMAAACQWLETPNLQGRLSNARQLAAQFTESVRDLPGIILHHDASMDEKLPSVALSFAGSQMADVASELRAKRVIASAGFQCAAQAHHALGTAESGVIRFSFGPGNSTDDVEESTEILRELLT